MSSTASTIRVPDSGRAQHLHAEAGACSLQGTRRDHNEDQQYVSPSRDLFIVADGMGGHAAGEVASKFAVDVLAHELAQIVPDASQQEVERRVHAALDRAHCLILDSAEKDPDLRGLGTTVVFGLLLNHRLYVTGVGDSRAYLVRGGTIQRLTIDDTWPDALFHLGQISADDARRHHLRNILMAALGMEDFDSNHEEIRAVDVFRGDRFLLASDGITDVVDEQRLLEILQQNSDPQVAAEKLVEEAVIRNSGDDVTCVVFSIGGANEHETRAATRPSLWQRLLASLRPASST